MQVPRTLIWLASYPKSGNTWLRAFLAQYLLAGEDSVNFDAINRVSSGDCSAPSYAELAGRDPAKLPLDAYLKVRHAHLARIASGGAPAYFIKTHAPHVKFGPLWLNPPRMTRQAIYLVRHPLDMLVSYADHWGISAEDAATQIASKNNQVPANEKTVAQYLGTWSEHVESWSRTRDFPVLVLKYEDLLANPEKAFTKVLKHIEAPVDKTVLKAAVAATRFDRLSALEASQGFPERGPSQDRFFRQGKAGNWRDTVSPETVEKVAADHGQTMQRLGYRT